MGEQHFPLDFTPQCPHLNWLTEHLDGWQFGEQGLIPGIVDALAAEGLCVEYGAGDGLSLPLTIDRMIVKRPGLCHLIENDGVRRSKLQIRYPDALVAESINWSRMKDGFVCVVVIDIDSSDSVVMREMFAAGVRPALLVVEHMDRHYPIGTSQPDPIPQWMLGMKLQSGHAIQDTAETLHAMAAANGYERIGYNRCNSFFVLKERYTDLFR